MNPLLSVGKYNTSTFTPAGQKQQRDEFIKRLAAPVASNTSATGTVKPQISTPSQSTTPQFTQQPSSPPPFENPNKDIFQTPKEDPNVSYRNAFSSYIESLKPSNEETQARKYLSDLTLQSKRDQEEALSRGETLGFASGEAQRVNRNNSFQIEGAANALDAFTGSRTAMTEAQKARLDFERGLLGDAQKAEELEYRRGQDKFTNDLATKKFNEEVRQFGVESAISRQKAGAAVNTSTGATLSPLAQAVQNGTIAIDKLPSAQRASVAAELATSGIPSSRQETLTSNLGVVNSLLNNNNRNKISGFIQGKLKVGNLQPSAQLALNQFNQLKGILSLENREKLKGSGAISDFEFKVLSDAATAFDRNLSDKEFDEQLKTIKEVFEGKYARTKETGGAQADASAVEAAKAKYGIEY